MVDIEMANTPAQLRVVRRLFGEYQRSVEHLLADDDACP